MEQDFVLDWISDQKVKSTKLVSYNNGYGAATLMNGYMTLNWNKEGIGLSYQGEKLEPNIAISIKLDGGTRYGFQGIVYNLEQFELQLKLVR